MPKLWNSTASTSKKIHEGESSSNDPPFPHDFDEKNDVGPNKNEENIPRTRNDTDNINNASGPNILVNENKNDQKITVDVPLDSDEDESKYVAGKALEAAGFENDIALTPKEGRYVPVNKKLKKRKITVFSRGDDDTKIVAGKALEAAESEIENARRARFETNRTLYNIGKKTLFVLFALSICCAAIYAAWVLPDYICQKRPEDVAQVPPTEVGLPEIVKIYREEELNINKEFYAKHGDLAPALELVWNEVGMKFLIHGLQKDLVEVKRQQNNSRPTDQLLTSYKERVKNFETIAKHFSSNKFSVHAVVAYYTAARIEWLKNNGRNTLLQIQVYTWHIYNITLEIAKTEPINTNLITDMITLMREMVEFVRSTESASEDHKVKYEVWCLKYIGLSYFIAGQYKDSAGQNEKATKVMDEHFGERAKTYHVYGNCLNNVGFNYGRMGDYDKAKKFYEAALLAYEKVEDWPNEKQKREEEETTKTNLQNALKKISNIT